MNWKRMGTGTEMSSAQSLFIFGIECMHSIAYYTNTKIWDPSLPAVHKSFKYPV